MLPATYEIDHVLALHMGGLDCAETNAEALCNTCHASKTIKERIARELVRTTAIMDAKAREPPPLRGCTRVLDAIPGPEFVENAFLRFGYVRCKKKQL